MCSILPVSWHSDLVFPRPILGQIAIPSRLKTRRLGGIVFESLLTVRTATILLLALAILCCFLSAGRESESAREKMGLFGKVKSVKYLNYTCVSKFGTIHSNLSSSVILTFDEFGRRTSEVEMSGVDEIISSKMDLKFDSVGRVVEFLLYESNNFLSLRRITDYTSNRKVETERRFSPDGSQFIDFIKEYDGPELSSPSSARLVSNGQTIAWGSNTFDSAGNRIESKIFDPVSGKVSVEVCFYDEKKQIIREISKNSRGSTISEILRRYNSNGDLLERVEIDGQGGTNRFERHTFDQGNRDTRHEHYDGRGNVLQLTTIDYDLVGRKIKESKYSSKGDIEEMKVWNYDSMGRETAIREYGSNGAVQSENATRYDDKGRKVQTDSTRKNNRTTEKWNYNEDGSKSLHEEIESTMFETRRTVTIFDLTGKITNVSKFSKFEGGYDLPTDMTTYVSDSYGRLIEEGSYKFASMSGSDKGDYYPVEILRHRYDPVGNIIETATYKYQDSFGTSSEVLVKLRVSIFTYFDRK